MLLQNESTAQVVDGFTITNHFLDARVLIFNADRWESLQSVTQENLTAAATSVNDDIAAGNVALVEQLMAAGEPVRELTDAQRAVWLQAVEPVVLQFQDSIGTDLVSAAQNSSSESE